MIFKLFKHRKLFSVEKLPLTQDELKYRFRRRIAILAFFIGCLILTYPVVLDRLPALQSKSAVRNIAGKLLLLKAQTALNKNPSMIEYKQKSATWTISFPENGVNCNNKKFNVPTLSVSQSNISWKLLYLKQLDSNDSGQEIQKICFHPLHGIYVNDIPLESGKLFLVAGPAEDFQNARLDRLQKLEITDFGSKIQMSSYNAKN